MLKTLLIDSPESYLNKTFTANTNRGGGKTL